MRNVAKWVTQRRGGSWETSPTFGKPSYASAHWYHELAQIENENEIKTADEEEED
jgi:hypothetical protein